MAEIKYLTPILTPYQQKTLDKLTIGEVFTAWGEEGLRLPTLAILIQHGYIVVVNPIHHQELTWWVPLMRIK